MTYGFARATVLLLSLLLLATACSSNEPETQSVAASETTSASSVPATSTPTVDVPTEIPAPATPEAPPTAPPTLVPTTAPVAAPTPVPRLTAPNGRSAPSVAVTPADLAAQFATALKTLDEPSSSPQELADWGHVHQVVIRKLGSTPDWDDAFFAALPAEYRPRVEPHLVARRALIDLSSGYDSADFIPAWQIVEPEPADALLAHYQEAEAATGIEWEYLAAINLIETGMGRIRGLSSAGAQGPMQFLPTTWSEAGIGDGDINDPRDAINAAARYLVRRGGPADMEMALWGYNNHDLYVTAVQAYAELLRQDPASYTEIYNWEIYFFTEAGDVWLPTGFRSEESIDLDDYLLANPWSVPDPGLR